MAFSSAVRIADVNDFIAPSQACVVGINGGSKDAKAAYALETAAVVGDAGAVQIHGRDDDLSMAPTPAPGGFGFAQAGVDGGTTAVKVTLNDCLACSGCVTSAETVLMEAQSGEQLLTALDAAAQGAAGAARVVVSLAPQTIASVAAAAGLSVAVTRRRLCAALKRGLGAAAVYDVAEGRDLALAEACLEFVQRYRGRAAGAPLPLLASSCPGWVCYAEKTAGSYVLPHISTVKSPQAVAGALIKRAASGAGARVLHAAVMPCADKKLEASRDELTLGGEPECDLVLTTIELQDMLRTRGIDIAAGGGPEDDVDALIELVAPRAAADGGTETMDIDGLAGDAQRASAPLGGSGGWVETVARFACTELFGTPPPPGPLPLAPLRKRSGADFQVCELPPPPGVDMPPLRFATVYGFKSIQGLLRKLKTKTCDYDYVEVMACPGGCLNGGGQLRPPEGVTARERLAEVDSAYHSAVEQDQMPWRAPLVRATHGALGGDGGASTAAREALRTSYKLREKPAALQATNW